MISLHTLFVPKSDVHPSLTYSPSLLQHQNPDRFRATLHVIKLVVTNAKLAGNAFLKQQYSKFDPIVHENSCQIRGFMVIAMTQHRSCRKAFRKEAHALVGAATRAEEILKKLINKPVPPQEEMGIVDIAGEHGLDFEVSPLIGAACLSHFLTVSKVFRINPDGSETAYIDAHALKQKMSKQVSPDLVKRFIDVAQVHLARLSVVFIQQEAAKLRETTCPEARFIEEQLGDDQIELVQPKTQDSLPRPCSLALYNFKTILLRMAEEGTIVLLKEYTAKNEKTVGVFFQAPHPDEPFEPLSDIEARDLDPKQPIFVIEGALPHGMDKALLRKTVSEVSLLRLALMNVAMVPHYSNHDAAVGRISAQACKELTTLREAAAKMGIRIKNPETFTIVHTHASSVEEELSRVV